jgi:hypothetical protein
MAFCGSIHFVPGVVTTPRFEYEECKTIGDNNCVPYPWMLFPFYMVNLNFNVGIQFGTFGNQGLCEVTFRPFTPGSTR